MRAFFVRTADGMPGTPVAPKPKTIPAAVHPALDTVKNAWTQKANAGPAPAQRTPQQSMEEADAYSATPHTPNHPALQKSYQSLIHAIGGQYNDLRSQGISFTPHTGAGEPYSDSNAMRADLATGAMKYLPTSSAGDLPDGHPMAQTINTVDGPKMANDVFRSVHDALGHGFGASFGPMGEQQAWANHRQTLPSEAHPALWSETRGQNVVTNYGQEMRDQNNQLLPKEQQPPLSARPFAEQKMVWAPHYAFFVRKAADPSNYFGKGFESLFTGDGPTTSTPFRQPIRLKTDKPIDQNLINSALANPTFNHFDPRTLTTPQPSVTRAGVKHYMDNPDTLFNDANQAGNQHPVVYTKSSGENVLLSGVHRATAALLAGKPLHAIHIKAPQMPSTSSKQSSTHSPYFVRSAATWDGSKGNLTFQYTPPQMLKSQSDRPKDVDHRVDAYVDGNHAGYMQLDDGDKHTPHGVINFVKTNPGYNGLGIGRAMGDHYINEVGIQPIHGEIKTGLGTGFAAALPEWPSFDGRKVRPGVTAFFVRKATIPDKVQVDSEHTAGMIALIPSKDDLSKLTVDGGDPEGQLHLTLMYLGEGDDWSEENKKDLLAYVDGKLDGPITAKVFAHAELNPDDNQCSVYLVSGLPDEVVEFKDDLIDVLDDNIPAQHVPWLAHITAGFEIDPNDLKFTGPITFDTLRVVWAGETYDFKL